MIRSSALVTLFLSAGLAIAAGPSSAAATPAEADWPCVQRMVPTLSAGMMWAGPPIAEDIADWKADAETRTLVERLAVRRTSLDEATRHVAAFTAGLNPADKAEKLTLVFSGLLAKANIERSDVLDGIGRYTRKQRSLADNILATRQELDAVLKVENPSDAEDDKRRALEEKLNWQTRIHEDRERSLVFICEIPVLLEQRLFELARLIAGHLD